MKNTLILDVKGKSVTNISHMLENLEVDPSNFFEDFACTERLNINKYINTRISFLYFRNIDGKYVLFSEIDENKPATCTTSFMGCLRSGKLPSGIEKIDVSSVRSYEQLVDILEFNNVKINKLVSKLSMSSAYTPDWKHVYNDGFNHFHSLFIEQVEHIEGNYHQIVAYMTNGSGIIYNSDYNENLALIESYNLMKNVMDDGVLESSLNKEEEDYVVVGFKQRYVDELLDKISEYGVVSLTFEEKEYLKTLENL